MDIDRYAPAQKTDFDEIPIISLSGLDTDSGFERIAQALVETAHRVGFFYLSDHGISPDVMDHAFAASRQFFDLPPEVKGQVAVNRHQRGWMRSGLAKLEGAATHDAKEVFFWGWEGADMLADPEKRPPLVHPNQWPEHEAAFLKNGIWPYYQQVMSLGRRVLSALAYGLGQSKTFFDQAYVNPLGRGQLVYYPPMDAEDIAQNRLGAAAHTDFGVLTILMQDMQGGLQVRNPAGHWIEAPPVQGTLVCNIGDLLERWTGGRLTSTVHRVINRNPTSRYSIPVFCDPASETPIDPRDFGATGNAENIISAGEYIMGRNTKNFEHYTSAKRPE
jgi:isopenicillin N synthase-like dioxygenase